MKLNANVLKGKIHTPRLADSKMPWSKKAAGKTAAQNTGSTQQNTEAGRKKAFAATQRRLKLPSLRLFGQGRKPAQAPSAWNGVSAKINPSGQQKSNHVAGQMAKPTLNPQQEADRYNAAAQKAKQQLKDQTDIAKLLAGQKENVSGRKQAPGGQKVSKNSNTHLPQQKSGLNNGSRMPGVEKRYAPPTKGTMRDAVETRVIQVAQRMTTEQRNEKLQEYSSKFEQASSQIDRMLAKKPAADMDQQEKRDLKNLKKEKAMASMQATVLDRLIRLEAPAVNEKQNSSGKSQSPEQIRAYGDRLVKDIPKMTENNKLYHLNELKKHAMNEARVGAQTPGATEKPWHDALKAFTDAVDPHAAKIAK